MADMDAKPPRFYREMNEVYAVFGINLEGFIPSLIVSAALIGIGLWSGVFASLVAGYWLAKRMVKDPTLHKEIMATLREGYRYCTPSYQEVKEPVSVILPTGEEISASDWLQQRKDFDISKA